MIGRYNIDIQTPHTDLPRICQLNHVYPFKVTCKLTRFVVATTGTVFKSAYPPQTSAPRRFHTQAVTEGANARRYTRPHTRRCGRRASCFCCCSRWQRVQIPTHCPITAHNTREICAAFTTAPGQSRLIRVRPLPKFRPRTIVTPPTFRPARARSDPTPRTDSLFESIPALRCSPWKITSPNSAPLSMSSLENCCSVTARTVPREMFRSDSSVSMNGALVKW